MTISKYKTIEIEFNIGMYSLSFDSLKFVYESTFIIIATIMDKMARSAFIK
jgi:hypothetical protein